MENINQIENISDVSNINPKKEEDIKELKEKLKTLKEKIIHFLADNSSENQKFFDEIFNLQNEVLSSADIREVKLEKEFNQILKVLNILHSNQDNRLKDLRENLYGLLQDYLDTKEKILELTEINCSTLQILKTTLIDIKKEINSIKNQKRKVSNFFSVLGIIFGRIFKNPLVQKVTGIFLILVFGVMFLYIVKHMDKDLYNDTKVIIKDTIDKTENKIMNTQTSQTPQTLQTPQQIPTSPKPY